jgi:anti-sigma B factor antagonist
MSRIPDSDVAGPACVAPPYACLVESGDGAVRASLHGDLDLLNADAVGRCLRDAIAARPREVVLDLRRVGFVDASGLHVAVVAAREAREAGVAFSLERGGPRAMRLFALCGLERTLTFRD